MQFVMATPQGPPWFCLSQKCSLDFKDDLKGKILMEQWGSSAQSQWSAVKKATQASASGQVCEDAPTVDHNLQASLHFLWASRKWQQQKMFKINETKWLHKAREICPTDNIPHVCVSWSGADGQTQTHRKRSCSIAAVFGFDIRQSNYERFKGRVLDLFFLLKVVWTHFNAKSFICCYFPKEKSDSSQKRPGLPIRRIQWEYWFSHWELRCILLNI